jgi:hypothetical protein
MEIKIPGKTRCSATSIQKRAKPKISEKSLSPDPKMAKSHFRV